MVLCYACRREYIHQRVESWAEQQSQTGTAQDGNKSAASVLRPTLIRMSAPPMFSSRVFPPEAAVTQAAGESEPEAGTRCG